MKTFRLAVRMLLRDFRAGELYLLGIAIVIAVASLSSVGFLADRVSRGLDREANQLLGGDLLLRSDQPWQADIREEAQRRGLRSTETILFTSMVSTAETAELAGIKVVEADYPLRGVVRIAAGPNQADHVVTTMPETGEVWLDERLFTALGVKTGTLVALGSVEFRVSGMISFESDRGTNFFSLLPRAIFNRSDLERTGLLVEGSRATWRMHIAGAQDIVDGFEQWAQSHLDRGQAIETIDNARPEVRSALDKAQQFLRLSALLAVVLTAVAVGLSAQRFMQRHLDACAVMRCLGAQQTQLLGIIIGEFILFGLAAALLGNLCGWVLQYAMTGVLGGIMQVNLPPPSILPWFHGLLVGMSLLLGFVLPQLLRLCKVSTLRVLRRELDPVERNSVLAWMLGVLVLLGILFWIAADLKLGTWVAAGFMGAFSVFALGAWSVLHLLGKLKGQGSLRGGGWRYGLASLRRRVGSSIIQISALGLGLAALLLLALVRTDLLDNWQNMAPPDAPNHFIINIQPDQRETLTRFFIDEGMDAPAIQPMIRGRLTAINGEPVKTNSFEDPRTRRLAEREFNLSYASQLPASNRITAGRWHAEDRAPQFSVETGLAETFRIKIGDKLRFDINGRSVEAPVSSLRELNWDSMRVNFFVIATNGMLENDPVSLITSFRLTDSQQGFPARLVNQLPNLTIIDVGSVIEQIRSVTDRLMLVVQFVFIFAVLAGIVVLYAALQSTHDERDFELAMLRTLGARNQQLRQALLAEFLALGSIAGLLAGICASALAWGLAHYVFKMPYTPSALPLLAGFLTGTLGVAAGGWLGTRSLLGKPPLTSLRALTS